MIQLYCGSCRDDDGRPLMLSSAGCVSVDEAGVWTWRKCHSCKRTTAKTLYAFKNRKEAEFWAGRNTRR